MQLKEFVHLWWTIPLLYIGVAMMAIGLLTWGKPTGRGVLFRGLVPTYFGTMCTILVFK